VGYLMGEVVKKFSLIFKILNQSISKKKNVDISSSDICDKDRKKRHDIRLISKRSMPFFILVQALSNSNSLMSSLAVLCCEIRCPG
jgi:hypothetical protein